MLQPRSTAPQQLHPRHYCRSDSRCLPCRAPSVPLPCCLTALPQESCGSRLDCLGNPAEIRLLTHHAVLSQRLFLLHLPSRTAALPRLLPYCCPPPHCCSHTPAALALRLPSCCLLTLLCSAARLPLAARAMLPPRTLRMPPRTLLKGSRITELARSDPVQLEIGS